MASYTSFEQFDVIKNSHLVIGLISYYGNIHII